MKDALWQAEMRIESTLEGEVQLRAARVHHAAPRRGGRGRPGPVSITVVGATIPPYEYTT